MDCSSSVQRKAPTVAFCVAHLGINCFWRMSKQALQKAVIERWGSVSYIGPVSLYTSNVAQFTFKKSNQS